VSWRYSTPVLLGPITIRSLLCQEMLFKIINGDFDLLLDRSAIR